MGGRDEPSPDEDIAANDLHLEVVDLTIRGADGVVRPGAHFTVTRPPADRRGIGYVLRRREGSAWVDEFFLLGGWGEVVPQAYRAGDPHAGVPEIAVGETRLTFLMPEDAPPGTYELCSLESPFTCYELEIEA